VRQASLQLVFSAGHLATLTRLSFNRGRRLRVDVVQEQAAAPSGGTFKDSLLQEYNQQPWTARAHHKQGQRRGVQGGIAGVHVPLSGESITQRQRQGLVVNFLEVVHYRNGQLIYTFKKPKTAYCCTDAAFLLLLFHIVSCIFHVLEPLLKI